MHLGFSLIRWIVLGRVNGKLMIVTFSSKGSG